MFYSSQGWPALGEQTVDLFVMSYLSGTISVLGGILGAFGIYAAYKVFLSIKRKSCIPALGATHIPPGHTHTSGVKELSFCGGEIFFFTKS